MKITLNNFRCYKETTTFEFDDVGSILLSGMSGVGKSTILMAINFALNNEGKKICTHGETKCRVEFIFKDLKIVRTKNPSRLVVNDVYEDAVAQQIINEIFGKHFGVTGYISQNTTDFFLNKGAIAKREFLESVQFENENLPEKKSKLDALIREYNQELEKTIAKLEMSRKLLVEKPTEVPFPLEKKKDKDQSIKNEKMRFNNAATKIQNCQKKIKKKETELNALRVTQTYLKSKDETINQICMEMENLSLEEKNHNDYIGDAQLQKYQQKLQFVKAHTQLFRLLSQRDEDEKKIQEMKDNEIAELQENVGRIKSKLWAEYTKEEALSVLETNKDVLADFTKVKSLKSKKVPLKDLESLESKKLATEKALDDAKTQLQSLDILTCPQCDASILLQNGILVSCEGEKQSTTKTKSILTKEIQELSAVLKRIEFDILQQHESEKKNTALDADIEAILSQYEDELNETELQEDLDAMQSYYKSQMALESKLRDYQEKIDNQYFSSSYQTCKKELERLNAKIKILEKEKGDGCDDEEEDDEETIREIITENTQKKTRLEHIRKQLLSKNEVKKTILSQMEEQKAEFLSKYTVMPDETVLKAEIEDLKNTLKKTEKEHEEHRLNLDKVNEYLQYKKDEELYNKQLENIKTLEQEEKVQSNKYTQAKLVKEGMFKAEHIALQNLIDTINVIANRYLQDFFEDTMFVNLSCFKEDKKKNEKPQIHLDIKYKDNNCVLESLSGGEAARVNLAFTLSLAEIFKTPLLLLDETMASLDEDVTEIVFSSIKKHFSNIPVISILHQVTSEGYFDQVIKL